MTVSFPLPGTEHKIECAGEIAWANSTRQAGVRFVDLSTESRKQLMSWLESQAPEIEKDDPPVPCKLTDLSPGAGYLETVAPFPVRATVSLAITVADVQVQVEGIVRVANPEIGMGVEFLRRTPPQRAQLEKFIQGLMNNPGVIPEIMVQPEGLDGDGPMSGQAPPEASEDPLLDLFRKGSSLATETFLSELRQQRGSLQEPAETGAPA
jgi:hypothetical protein